MVVWWRKENSKKYQQTYVKAVNEQEMVILGYSELIAESEKIAAQIEALEKKRKHKPSFLFTEGSNVGINGINIVSRYSSADIVPQTNGCTTLL